MAKNKPIWRSNIPKLIALLEREEPRALTAAAQVLVNAVKRGLKGGYTTGDFVTGMSLNKVTKSEPVKRNGQWSISVGTNLMYNLFWELGHHNVFTRRYERVEVWRPALEDNRARMSEVFARYLKDRIARLGPLPR